MFFNLSPLPPAVNSVFSPFSQSRSFLFFGLLPSLSPLPILPTFCHPPHLILSVLSFFFRLSASSLLPHINLCSFFPLLLHTVIALSGSGIQSATQRKLEEESSLLLRHTNWSILGEEISGRENKNASCQSDL